MGDGVVLESGTHAELLADANGPYSRLVQAQKLREAREATKDDGDSDTAASNEEDLDRKVSEEEIPLGRSHTGRSLASEILEQKRKEKEGGNIPNTDIPTYRHTGRGLELSYKELEERRD